MPLGRLRCQTRSAHCQVSLRREQALYAPSLHSHAAPWCPGAFASLLLLRGELRYEEVGVNGTFSSFISLDNCCW